MKHEEYLRHPDYEPCCPCCASDRISETENVRMQSDGMTGELYECEDCDFWYFSPHGEKETQMANVRTGEIGPFEDMPKDDIDKGLAFPITDDEKDELEKESDLEKRVKVLEEKFDHEERVKRLKALGIEVAESKEDVAE